MRAILCVAVMLGVAAGANAAAPPGTSPVLRELRQYYETGEWPKTWHNAEDELQHEDAAVRRRAVGYLLKLMRQSVIDERKGAEWEFGSRDNEPRPRTVELRHSIAAAARQACSAAEVRPMIDWLMDEEPSRSIQAYLDGFLRTSCGEARSVAVRLLRKPDPNPDLLVGALRYLGERGVEPPRPQEVEPFSHHHRSAVRKEARALLATMKRPLPAKFDPVQALGSPKIQSLLRSIREELLEAPPVDAGLMSVTVRLGKGKSQETHVVYGWQRKEQRPREDSGAVSLVVFDGLTVRSIPADGKRTFDGMARAVASEHPRPAEEVRRVLAELGKLECGRETPAYPMALAWWLIQRGEKALGARLFFALLERVAWDEILIDSLRKDAWAECGGRMFEAFVNRRDYRSAIYFARRLAHRYPGESFAAEAKQLLAELPRRLDDFAGLKLPTPAEWRVLRANLTREEQIDFLCRRLRLINGPPEYAFPLTSAEQKQFRDPTPTAMPYRRDPYDEITPPRTVGRNVAVINPLAELRSSLKLTIDDVPRLVGQMRENWCLVSGGPDWGFNGAIGRSYSLQTTRVLLAALINDLARKAICQVEAETYGTPLPESEIRANLASAIRFARRHRGKSAADLEAYWFEEERTAERKEWAPTQLITRIGTLHEARDPRVTPLLHALLLDRRTSRYERPNVLAYLSRIEPQRGQWFARNLLAAREEGVRVRAALLCLHTNERASSLRVLGKYLRDAGREEAKGQPAVSESWVEEAMLELLADGSAEAKREALRVFEGEALIRVKGYVRARLLRRLADESVKEAYAFYLPLLRTDRSKVDKDTHKPLVDLYADEIAKEFGRDDKALQAALRKQKALADRIPILEQWLKRRIAALEKE